MMVTSPETLALALGVAILGESVTAGVIATRVRERRGRPRPQPVELRA